MKRTTVGILSLLLSLFFLFALSPAIQAQNVDEKIQALEQELGRLKAEQQQVKDEQLEMKKEAVAAAAAVPTFTYRPGAGVRIEAEDGSWAFRPRIRWHYRLNFFPGPQGVSNITAKTATGARDTSAAPKFKATNGFTQFDLALRRVYPYFTFYWDKGFYEVDFQMNLGDDRSIIIQKNEFHAHLEKLNPYLPEYTVGTRVSAFFNQHDTNWGSANAGFFERSMFQSGAGIGAGSQNNGMGLDWHDLPIGGLGRIVLLEGVVSNQGLDNLQNRTGSPGTDKRSAHAAIQVEPFSNIKIPWIQGIDFGFSAHTDGIRPDFDGKTFFRVRTATSGRELELIQQANNVSGTRYYLTPGLGWKIGPYYLRTAGGFNRGHVDSNTAGQEGPLVQGNMWRVGHELWLWSPKGLLTGSPSTPGSTMFFTVFERDDYEASSVGNRNGLKGCSSVTVGGNCHAASAHQASAGLWYFIRSGLSVGAKYDFYHVNKITDTGGARVVKVGTKAGQEVDFQNIELGVRVEW